MTLCITIGLSKAGVLHKMTDNENIRLGIGATSFVVDVISILGMILVGILGVTGVIAMGSSTAFAITGAGLGVLVLDIIGIAISNWLNAKQSASKGQNEEVQSENA